MTYVQKDDDIILDSNQTFRTLPMSDALNNIRKRLDTLDRGLVESLAERDRLVQEVASIKATSVDFIRDLKREEELLSRIVEIAAEEGLSTEYVTRLFRDILDHSVRRQQRQMAENAEAAPKLRVVYQGTEGSYSRVAAGKHFASFDGDIDFVGLATFKLAIDAVRNGDADYGVLPIENTTAGSINETYDLLARYDLHQIGEEVHKIEHCLLTVDNVPLSHVRRIFSQVQALAQCTDFLDSLDHCQAMSYTDTAMSCQKIRDDQDLSQAAIASEEAAHIYGLHVIKRNIANQKENFTRFAVVSPHPIQYDRRVLCKTSLVLATRHEQGALLQCMAVLARHQLNLTKLESRPRPGIPWEYLFYVDFEGNIVDPNVQSALLQLKAHTSYLKVLGSYPARNIQGAQPASPRISPPAPSATPSNNLTDLAQLALTSFQLASRASRADDTIVKIGPCLIGGHSPALFAGPSLISSRPNLLKTTSVIKTAENVLLMGGCFATTTSPYAFQGLGQHGLELLHEIGQLHNIPVITTISQVNDVERAAPYVDALRIIPEQMHNLALLQAVGRRDLPVILTRSSTASINEWLTAAETILSQGNQQVILLEQGIRTFETSARLTLDLNAIPILRQRTHLPVLIDPSYSSLHASHILPVAKAALAAGAQGLMLSVTSSPDDTSLKNLDSTHLSIDEWLQLNAALNSWL